MLMSTASGNEADDDDFQVLAALDRLEPELTAAWEKNSARFNALLVSSLIKRGEPGYEEQRARINAGRAAVNFSVELDI
jgi:hypothetical protein